MQTFIQASSGFQDKFDVSKSFQFIYVANYGTEKDRGGELIKTETFILRFPLSPTAKSLPSPAATT